MDDLTEQIIALKEAGHTWREICGTLGIKKEAARSRYRNFKKKKRSPTCTATGVMTDEPPDEDEVYRRACREWEKTRELEERRNAQSLEFSRGPVALVAAADLHLGGGGVDYPRVFEEAELIANTPGMYLILLGDLVDNFIVSSLIKLRLFTRLTITDEWTLVRRYLRIVGPKVRATVGGNHDYWLTMLSGIDYLRDTLAAIVPGTIYDQDDAKITVRIGKTEWPGRIRHKWRGTSIYNETHGIERAAKWDQDFLWAIGAHTHRDGVVRSFNHAGRQGWSAMCGSYKRVDHYATQGGFPNANNSIAIALVFDEDTGSITGFDNLEMCARFMRKLYTNEETD